MSNNLRMTDLCRRIRSNIISSTTEAKSGHPSSSLSAVELTAVLFFGDPPAGGFFYQDIAHVNYPFNDKFILSKGHAAPLLYSLYEAAGVLTHTEMLTLRKFNSRLQGHPTPELPFVDVATGSLGQGLSVGLGMALGLRLKIKELGIPMKREPTVWVLLGDSEMAEGQVWEAMEVASFYKVNNLVGIVDMNRLGQSGETELAWDGEAYKKRIETFGWRVLEIKNGHNIDEIQNVFKKVNAPNTVRSQKPTMILARTVKGKGISFMENKEGWHGKPVPAERLKEVLKEIGPYNKKIKGIITPPQFFDYKTQEKTKIVLNRLTAVIDSVTALLRPLGAPRTSSDMRAVGVPSARATYDRNLRIATREAFGDALKDLGRSNPAVVALDGEVGNSTYTERIKETNPSHFLQMFIDEENMVSVGLGLSKMGYVPFISTFAAFFTRAFDQLRMSQYSIRSHPTIHHQSLNTLNIVGSHAGCSIGQDGVSQMGLEDIAMMRSIRESTVLYPSDGTSAYFLTKELASRPGINYLRTTRGKTTVIYEQNEQFPIGGCKVHYCHPDENRDPEKSRLYRSRVVTRDDTKYTALIIAAGVTLHESLKAQKILEKKQIHTIVVDLYSIKPLDTHSLSSLVKKTDHVVVVEDHYAAGGIGEAVLSSLSTSHQPLTTNHLFTHLCVRKEPRSGTPEELLRYEEIDAQAIISAVTSG